jgi:predicted nuclease of predicted toxin-antitoxin system
MNLLCDINIPDSLIGALKSESVFSIEEVENVLPSHPPDSQKSNYADRNSQVLLTDDHKFLQNTTNHGVIHYADPKLSDSRAVRLIKQIRKNNTNRKHSAIAAAIP